MTLPVSLVAQEHHVQQQREEAAEAGGSGPAGWLLVCEPPGLVFTVGVQGGWVVEERRLRALGAAFAWVSRGRLLTFHGPGQLVAYPVLDLQCLGLPLHAYVAALKRLAQAAASSLSLPHPQPWPLPTTSLWIRDNKLCAIGVHCGRHIMSHGLALNCCTDLIRFDHIVPCGLEGKGVTSLSQELGRHVSVEEATKPFLDAFQEVFKCTLTVSEEPWS
uniref:putative lipoyltransferase 2, mitochondrial n=1 Tax=Euleptes europaea TaxID=460621 RepID=UPI0025421F15|nr:putative lipoyltransferase 2, mitochondrial [Euleptes europaea]